MAMSLRQTVLLACTALTIFTARTAAQSQAGVPPSAPPSAGADLSQFIDENPGGARHRRLFLTGITWEAPAAQPLPVTVYDTLPWLWPRSETSQANTPPGLNDE